MSSRITQSFIADPELQRRGWDGKISLDDVAPAGYLDGLSHSTGPLEGEQMTAIYDPDPEITGAVIAIEPDKAIDFREVVR